MPIRPELVSWQWSGYPTAHRTRANLLIHIFTAPVFWAGVASVVAGAVQLRAGLAGAGVLAMVLVVALQGAGHRREPNPPIPFLGPLDFVTRFFTEQFVNFPRFVLTGAWLKALRGS
jgi:hypothetical protein